MSGAGPARLAQFDAIVGALPLITIGSVLLIGLIVGLHFRSSPRRGRRSPRPAIAYGLTVRVLGWAGEQAGLSIPREVEPVLVVLLLGLVTDYAVFYLSAFRDALPGADSSYAAMRAATAATGRVVLTAGLIVAAGTAALVAGRLDFFRAFGPGLAITALIAVAVCLTFLPACLALFGRRLVPERPRADPPAGASSATRQRRRARPGRRRARRERLATRLRMRTASTASALGGASRAARRARPAALARARRPDRHVAAGCRAGRARLRRGARARRDRSAPPASSAISLVPSLPADDSVPPGRRRRDARLRARHHGAGRDHRSSSAGIGGERVDGSARLERRAPRASRAWPSSSGPRRSRPGSSARSP